MNNDNNDDSDEHYQGDDAATGEYPVLFDRVDDTGTLPVLNGVPRERRGGGARAGAGDEAEVSGWLAHLETEIARLHARWQQVELGFHAKDALLADLKAELTQRDAALADRGAQLDRSADACAALERTLADRNATLVRLGEELAARDSAHERDAAALASAEAELGAAERELAAARTEIAALSSTVERERAAVVALTGRNDELLTAQAAMKQRLQELETYIDGRAQTWSVLKDQIAAQKSAILRLERGLKTREVAIEEGLKLRRDLEQKLLELKTQNDALHQRRQERDTEYAGLERRLAEQVAAEERLAADLAERVAERDRLLSTSVADRASISTLEAAAAEKDAALLEIEARLVADRARAGERLDGLRLELAEREAELARSRAQVERETERATRLAAELEAKQSSVDLLQRSVHRISDLGASLAELERRIGSSRSTCADDAPPAPAPAAELTELLPIESFMTVGDREREAADGPARLIGSLGGENVTYALSKTEMTIGRGKTSDIRIPSHFISRLHAKVSTRGIATMIEDVGSKNGIFVNAHRIKRCVLRDGDIVSLASELEFKFIDAAH
jgi:pSer/pThr/pTyr-binding forkhead associated (FHA) protein